VDEDSIRKGLANGLFLFGSYLQALLLKPFGGPPPFIPGDVDFFYSVNAPMMKLFTTLRFKDCVPTEIYSEWKKFPSHPVVDEDYKTNLNFFQLFERGPYDFAIAYRNENESLGILFSKV